jgi:hypothetical protein
MYIALVMDAFADRDTSRTKQRLRLGSGRNAGVLISSAFPLP